MKFFLIALGVSALFLITCSNAKTSHRRYFLIGYIADNIEPGRGFFNGGADTAMDHYPSFIELDDWLGKKYHIKNIRIISVCEQTKEDHDAFWKVK